MDSANRADGSRRRYRCFSRNGQSHCRNQSRDERSHYATIWCHVSQKNVFILIYLSSVLCIHAEPLLFLCNTIVSDDTVEVGAKLYEIDTDATAAVSTKDAPKSEAKKASVESEPKAGPSKKATPPPNASKTPARTPSIHFLGKEGWASRLSGQKLNQPQVVYIPPMYGRPKFTQEEMDALITGGADLAPSVLDYSRGAKFQAF